MDDDKNILETFKKILQSEGHSVDTAHDGREAIEKSKTEFYNLALLGIKLPDTEATELLTKMHGDTPQMMKIMVTGYSDFENAVDSLNKGADAHIIKPVDPDKLLKVVGGMLKEQEEVETMTEDKVADWIRTRIRRLERGQGAESIRGARGANLDGASFFN